MLRGTSYGDTTYCTTTSGAGALASGTMMWSAALAGTTTGTRTGLTDASVASPGTSPTRSSNDETNSSNDETKG
ncbi:MAG: hypothetical protein M9891_12445 [Austwickia sp.]|nr:hypothetical protein [Austwickia sp.]